MSEASTPVSLVNLSGVLSALSCALDLTEGQPQGHAVRSCLIGMRVGEAVGLDPETRSALYYALILKDAGCSSNAAHVAALFGSDDQAVKSHMKLADWSRAAGAALYGIRSAAIGRPLPARLRHLVRLAGAGTRGARELVRIRCQRGAEIVRDLGLPPATAEAIRALDEHWDGRGHPAGLRGREIPLLARIVSLAQTTDVFLTSRGPDAALRMVRERRGTWFDPDLADVVLSWQDDGDWWDGLRTPEATRLVGEAEPADYVRQVDEAGLDEVAEVFAGIIDAKTPFTHRHSARVAGYARDIADELGMDPAARRQFYRAGLLHDIGKLGVSNRILDKPGRLTDEEREEVKRHPRYTLEILGQISAFDRIAEDAARHHERLDGRGYPWGLTSDQLSDEARVLAVADVYEALTAQRPYRDPLPRDRVLAIMAQEAGTAFDPACLDALAEATALLDVPL